MNLWGLTPAYLEACRESFPAFLDKGLRENPEKCEFLLPSLVSDMMSTGKCDVKVMESVDKWYGVTYKEDKESVVEAFREMIRAGKYPSDF